MGSSRKQQQKVKRFILSKSQKEVEVKFRKPVTELSRTKNYILKDGADIIYVGYTSRSIGTRLSGGMQAHSRYGYHGYKWKRKLDQVNLVIFVFDEKLTGDKGKDALMKTFVEAIEAELVYLFRSEKGRWPEYQNEIHFNNSSREEVLRIAKEIYAKLS